MCSPTNEVLQALDVEGIFGFDGALDGTAGSEVDLGVGGVVHESVVAIDEIGVEAAAASAALMVFTSGAGTPEQTLIIDRPFFLRIVDQISGATLFVGQVTDPTAG